MKLDRQRIAVLFLIVAVLVRILLPFALLVFSGLPIPTGMLWTFFTATIAGTLPGALPYLVLLLVSFAVRSRATVWGGGITLVLVEILARIPLRSAEPSLYSMLFVAPASAVFVLPVGLLLGAAVGRLFHATEEPSGSGPKSASAQMAANGAIAYDEIFDYPAGILKARQPDGAETLLVTGNGLSAIRPRQGSGRVPNQGESGT